LSVPARVAELLRRMTLAEKIAEMQVDTGGYFDGHNPSFNPVARHPHDRRLHDRHFHDRRPDDRRGDGPARGRRGPTRPRTELSGYEGYVPPDPVLCIPALTEQDNSAGVPGITQLPASIALGSSWDPGLAYQFGAVKGAEHFEKGMTMYLGPAVDIQRDPRWGRNFQMLSEDPYLTAALAVPEVEGIQAQHVVAVVKHFAAYNQETYRNTMADDAIVSVRALHEIYLPAFEQAVEVGHAAAVMCSYARVNGAFSCQNRYLLRTTLIDRWGFQGIIRSDGGANHSTVQSVNAGLDQEKGSDYFGNGRLARAVADHLVSIGTINSAVSRILTVMFDFGLFNHYPTGNLHSFVSTPARVAFARRVAEQGTVLLRNARDILPLSTTISSLAIIGADASSAPLTSGGGSGHVSTPDVVSPLAGILAAVSPRTGVTSYAGNNPAVAAAVAREARVAIVFAKNSETEGRDLKNITLQGDQNAVIAAVARANPATIVVLNTGGPVTMPWLSKVRGVLEAWYPGQQDGNAIAAILFGAVDPSGHLAETFPVSMAQVPTRSPAQFPGVGGKVEYSEGIFVGYRYYDEHHITPLFPFGYGLSYTSFSFSHLTLSAARVGNSSSSPRPASCACNHQAEVLLHASVVVTNTGKRAGAEVAQLYLGDPPVAGEPPRQLKGFERVYLRPGESETVDFPLTGHDLSYWSDQANGWVVPTGRFTVYVGDSSALSSLHLEKFFRVVSSIGATYASLDVPSVARPAHGLVVLAHFVNKSRHRLVAPRFALVVPPGWQSRPGGDDLRRAPDEIAPGGVVTRSWAVWVPSGAAGEVARLRVSLRATRRNEPVVISATRRVAVRPVPLVDPRFGRVGPHATALFAITRR